MDNYNTLYVSALNHVKNEKKVSFKEQAARLGVKEKEIYNIRQGLKIVTKLDLENFLETFSISNDEILEDINENENYGKMGDDNVWRQVAEARLVIVNMQKEKITDLEKMIERLLLENNRLRHEK